jgi:hypothetical protein
VYLGLLPFPALPSHHGVVLFSYNIASLRFFEVSFQFRYICYLSRRLSCITKSSDLSNKYLENYIVVLTEGFKAPPQIKEANVEI